MGKFHMHLQLKDESVQSSVCFGWGVFEEIKQAYRRKAKEMHPDHNPNDPSMDRKFRAVKEAYEEPKIIVIETNKILTRTLPPMHALLLCTRVIMCMRLCAFDSPFVFGRRPQGLLRRPLLFEVSDADNCVCRRI